MTRAGRAGLDDAVRTPSRWCVAVLIGSILAGSCAGVPPARAPCVFPGPPVSAIASGIPMAGDSAFRGRVLSIAGTPLQGILQLEPGGYESGADSMGRFQFLDVPRGRYLLRVQMIGFVTAVDSVTYGEYGLEVLAALAPYQLGLHECVRR